MRESVSSLGFPPSKTQIHIGLDLSKIFDINCIYFLTNYFLVTSQALWIVKLFISYRFRRWFGSAGPDAEQYAHSASCDWSARNL